jgi:GNAT superfamily N-acetyltransferase
MKAPSPILSPPRPRGLMFLPPILNASPIAPHFCISRCWWAATLLSLFSLVRPAIMVRIYIDGNQAIFRRVAIREDLQQASHGRILLTLAESFAQEKGCLHIWSDVAPDAVGFYERCGYKFVPSALLIGTSISMQKNLA